MHRATMAAALLWSFSAAAQVRSVALQPPARDFGYLVGDRFTSTAVILTSSDMTLDRRSLPSPGPVATSIDITQVDETEDAAADGKRFTLRVTYESFVAPEEVSRATVPGYAVSFSRGGATLNAAVPAFDFSATIFRHDLQPVLDKSVLRPDPPVTRVDIFGPRRELYLGSAATLLAVVGLALTGGLAAFARSGSAPFAQARRAVRRTIREAGSDASRDALLALHRAFDLTAGARVMADDVEGFVAHHPRFAALRHDIETFFNASRNFFFGPDHQAPALPTLDLLSRDLARAERR